MDIKGYDLLIQKFLDKKITPIEFEKLYFEKFGEEPGGMPDELYEPLQWLFSELDSYFDAERFGLTEEDFDPEVDITEDQLRKSAQEVFKKIQSLK